MTICWISSTASIWCGPHCTKFGRHCPVPPLRLYFDQTLLKEKSTTHCTPLTHSLSVWVVCLWCPAHIEIPGILVCICDSFSLLVFPLKWYHLTGFHQIHGIYYMPIKCPPSQTKIAYILQAWVKYLLWNPSEQLLQLKYFLVIFVIISSNQTLMWGGYKNTV